MYSSILLSKGGKLSLRDRISTTKSGQSGANPSCSSSLRASHLSRFIHAASGESMAVLGSVKREEESKLMPVQSFWAQSASWKLRLELRIPVFEPVGGMAIDSPVEVSSSRRSRLARHNSSNCSGVIMSLTFTNR